MWRVAVLVVLVGLFVFLSVLFSKKEVYIIPEIQGKTIWLLWLQGWDQAPWIVQKARESWEKLNPGWNIELVDEKNLEQYSKIEYIDKIKSPAAKSDAIRLNLLATHGGVWADATLLCMHPLDNWIYDALDSTGFWMYHGRDEGRGPASWFITSTRGSPIIHKWKEACDKYWKTRSVEDDYFWMDGLFADLLNSDREFNQEWSKVPHLWCEAPGQSHMLAKKTQGNDPDLKQIISNNPPYVLKLSREDGNFSEESNAYFAIQKALEGTIPDKLHDMIHPRSSGFTNSVVVVADCGKGEDLSKIATETNAEVLSYDKCNFCKTAPRSVYCRPRRNVGREQETYLHFVTKNYENLPKNIVFLPTPLAKHDRWSRFQEILKTGENKYHDGLTLEGQESFELPEYEGRTVARAETFPYRKWYEKHIGDWDPTLPIVWNGIFKTTRDKILEKPLHIFENLFHQSGTANDAEVGHFLERSMTSIY